MMNTKTGIELIAQERQRQIEVEGLTIENDGIHIREELAFAAATYALPGYTNTDDFRRVHLWPFSPDWWKPTPNDRIRELVKAGALIAAEIDRLQNQQL